MRLLSIVVFALMLVACGGGSPVGDPPVQDVDPTGFWESDQGSTWTVVEFESAYLMDFPQTGYVDLRLTVSGDSFTATGFETAGSVARVDYLVTGTITGNTMVGNWQMTSTKTNGDVEITDTPFTALR